MTTRITAPIGLDHGLDREVDNLRDALFQVECAKAQGELDPEAEQRCREALAELDPASADFAVVTQVYSARARLAGIPAARRAAEMAKSDAENEPDPERFEARSVLRELAERLLAQRMQVLHASITAAHGQDIAAFRAAVARCARRITFALNAKVPA